MPVAAVAAGGALLGGAAGSQQDQTTLNKSGVSRQTVDVAPAGQQEIAARDTSFNALNSLDARLKQLESSPVLSNLEKLMQELGGSPTAERINQANVFADQAFAPQQTQLNQAFEDQTRAYQSRAAQMGRSSADPILAAKLAQEQVRQQAMLNANKGSFAANEAINAPARQFQNQLGALNGLQQQAIENRKAVYSLGSDFANTQANFRLATAGKTTVESSSANQLSGGGFKGLVTGALGGASSGLSLGSSLFPGSRPNFSSGFVARGEGV